MSGHRLPDDLSQADWTLVDPGNAGVIVPSKNFAVMPLVSAGAETRTLPNAAIPGLVLTLCCKTFVGNIVITAASSINTTGNTIITISAAGQAIELQSVDIGGTFQWRVTANMGTALS